MIEDECTALVSDLDTAKRRMEARPPWAREHAERIRESVELAKVRIIVETGDTPQTVRIGAWSFVAVRNFLPEYARPLLHAPGWGPPRLTFCGLEVEVVCGMGAIVVPVADENAVADDGDAESGGV